jgi:hypothetical protein
MTGGVYVWPQSMEFRVYDKSSGVDELISSTDTIALSVNMYHVGHFEQRKVDSVRLIQKVSVSTGSTRRKSLFRTALKAELLTSVAYMPTCSVSIP